MELSESYPDSFTRFIERTGGGGRQVPDVTRRPNHDDENPGPSLFRAHVENCSLQKLNLPGIFVGRSELTRVDFSGSLLRLSSFSWTDFDGCSFADCDLTECDLRGSSFVGCDFSRAQLADCDLRHASFEDCTFADANTVRIRVSGRLRKQLGLSPAQAKAAMWLPDDGPEPPGA